MFTGIIEALGEVVHIKKEGTNYHFTIASPISGELKIDQSLAHDGVCLTVVKLEEGRHVVTAIEETMKRSKLGSWTLGSKVNLERAMKANARLDGHMVQGHVDTTGNCVSVEESGGSWYFRFSFEPSRDHMVVDKGSVCINGVSLTVVDPRDSEFSVAIIPYTYDHTNFHQINVGDTINLEFDIIGKYLSKYIEVYGLKA